LDSLDWNFNFLVPWLGKIAYVIEENKLWYKASEVPSARPEGV
jgi:hypothetical protein